MKISVLYVSETVTIIQLVTNKDHFSYTLNQVEGSYRAFNHNIRTKRLENKPEILTLLEAIVQLDQEYINAF